MKKLKLMTVVGTRPEIIKMSACIKLFDELFDHVLVHTGQNYDYELNQVFFDELGLREPDYYLDVVGKDLGETMGNVISKSYSLMGNRCFDENLPEEVNRRIVDTTSDINLCYSEHARRNLLDMGCDPARVMVVGSPMREVLEEGATSSSDVLEREGLQPSGYILLSAHREENIDIEANFEEMVSAINAMAEEYQVPILYSMHPRSRKFIEALNTQFHPLVRASSPYGFRDYITLQKNALCVVSDSGTLAEESAILGFPAVSLRTSTERPEVIDKGVFTLGCLNASHVLQAMRTEIELYGEESAVPDYQDQRVSIKVAKIIQGYTPYVDMRIWGK